MIKGSNEESWSVSNNFSPKIRGYSNPDPSFRSRKKQRKHFAVSPRRSSISFPSSGPGVFEICQKKRKEERKGKGKKEKRGEKKTQTRAYTQGKERENWLATTNPFSKPLRTGTPASRSETVAVWPMNFNARPDNNKGAFIGQFLAGWLGRPSGSSAVQTAG